MSTIQPYPIAEEGEETVGDVLANAFSGKHFADPNASTATRMYTLKSDDTELSEALSHYRLRSGVASLKDMRPALRELLDHSALTPPDPFFVGPKVSQALLSLHPSSKLQIRNYLPADKVGTLSRMPILDIVPFHEGQTLHNYVGGNSPNLKKQKKLMSFIIEHPEKVEALFEQVAFLALQDYGRKEPDIHSNNIMVHEKIDGTLELSLVDIVSLEDTKKHLPPERGGYSDNRYRALNMCSANDKSLLRSLYSCVGYEGDDQKMYDLSKTAQMAISRAWFKVEGHIGERTVGDTHPEWKGFTEVNDVSVIPMNAPSWVLRDALDKLYERAVPSAEAAR